MDIEWKKRDGYNTIFTEKNMRNNHKRKMLKLVNDNQNKFGSYVES
jgi:hypothetical protein